MLLSLVFRVLQSGQFNFGEISSCCFCTDFPLYQFSDIAVVFLEKICIRLAVLSILSGEFFPNSQTSLDSHGTYSWIIHGLLPSIGRIWRTVYILRCGNLLLIVFSIFCIVNFLFLCKSRRLIRFMMSAISWGTNAWMMLVTSCLSLLLGLRFH